MNNLLRFLSLFYLLSLTPFIYSGQKAGEHDSRLAWLNRRLLELDQIKAGCTRAQVKKLLQECDGFYTISEQPFFDTECPFIKICANFNPRHKTARSMSDDDILVGRSRPYLEIDSYDHRDYPDENDASRTYFWLLDSMEQMGKCAVGSTREELLTIFLPMDNNTPEKGVFVHRDNSCIRIEVEFECHSNSNGEHVSSPQDRIVRRTAPLHNARRRDQTLSFQ